MYTSFIYFQTFNPSTSINGGIINIIPPWNGLLYRVLVYISSNEQVVGIKVQKEGNDVVRLLRPSEAE